MLLPSMAASTPPATWSLRPASIILAVKQHALLLFTLLGIMWALEIVDLVPFVNLDRYGIVPWTLWGLVGIFFAPFLHLGLYHLITNTLPFLILGGIVLLAGRTLYWTVTMLAVIGSGIGVWLFGGANTMHMGVSGVVFGYLGFLLARGIFERSLPSLLVSCAILLLYGGLLFGVLPIQRGISWQAHLFGFLAGVGAARLLVKRVRGVATQDSLA